MADDVFDRQERAAMGALKTILSRRAFLPALASSSLATVHLPAHAKQSISNSESGTVWWSELRTRDPIGTQAFYAGVMGWIPKVVAQDDTSRPPAAGEKTYTLFTMCGQEVAGAEEIEADSVASVRPGWFTYVQVDDVDEAVRKTTEYGGKIAQQPVDVPAVGRIAEIEDPEGNRIGLVSPRA